MAAQMDGVPEVFQFTRPQGARLLTNTVGVAILRFQFTRPQGARLTTIGTHKAKSSFNSRARKGRDLLMVLTPFRAMFQFTRPQGARLVDHF